MAIGSVCTMLSSIIRHHQCYPLQFVMRLSEAQFCDTQIKKHGKLDIHRAENLQHRGPFLWGRVSCSANDAEHALCV